VTVSDSGILAITHEQHVVAARQLVRQLAQRCGFSLVDQTKLVTAASELGRNTFKYGGGGAMHWEVRHDGGRCGVRLQFVDEGPGIPDLEQAMTDGWTSGAGLGMGLSGAKRLVNDFDIKTEVGRGTTVAIARWK
jgi:serine/threonine-protein kinase RsbT